MNKMNKELSRKINELIKTQKYDEEVVDTLIAISVTAKVLAKKIQSLKEKK